MEIRNFSDKERFYRNALNFVINLMDEILKGKEIFTFALAGGNTPIPLYERLSKVNIPWNRIHLFWGDERFSPSSDPQNNFRVAYDIFISKISIPAENVHKINTDFSDPEDAAQDYERKLLDFFGTIPEFDLTLLGMGEDGHTASIFPKSPIVNELKRVVVATPPLGNPKVRRITLTLRSINNSKNIIFLISGENKKRILREIVEKYEESVKKYPAALVKGKEKTIWFVN